MKSRDDNDTGDEATIWRVLRAGHLRAMLHGTGKRPDMLSAAEVNAVLEPLDAAIEHDLQNILVVVRHARADTATRLRRLLHDAPGVDHEMLDEAIDYATSPRGGWRPQ